MKPISQAISIGLGALALGATVAVQAAAPVITSFTGNGVLASSNLAPGSVPAVEWASSVKADSNGQIQVSVPIALSRRRSGRGEGEARPPPACWPLCCLSCGFISNGGGAARSEGGFGQMAVALLALLL